MRISKMLCWLTLVLSLNLAGSAHADPIKVGFITKFPSGLFSTLQNAAKEYASKNPDIQVIFGQGQSATDIAGQINLIESMVSQGVKGIAITPVSPELVPALDKAVAAGVKIVLIDNDIPNPSFDSCHSQVVHRRVPLVSHAPSGNVFSFKMCVVWRRLGCIERKAEIHLRRKLTYKTE